MSLGLLASKWSRAGFGVSYKGQTQRVITARVATWLEIVNSGFAINVEAQAIWPSLAQWGTGVLCVGEWCTSTCTAQSQKGELELLLGKIGLKGLTLLLQFQENNGNQEKNDNVKNSTSSENNNNVKNNTNSDDNTDKENRDCL